MQLDLNVLTVLNALLEEGSVTGAAQRLHLSTPAVSRTLGRIRSMTGDQILVRTGRTMTPTPYALVIGEQVHQLVLQARAVLAPHRELDLATLERTFTLRCHDALASAIAATLVSQVQVNAPGVTLRLLAESAIETNDLRHGRVDLEIGATQPDVPELRSETVGEAHLALALRPDHPLLDHALSVEAYAAAQHVIVSRRGHLHDPIDDALALKGLSRRVVAAAPSSTIALQIVAATGTVASIIENGCRPALDALGLRAVPLPISLPAVPVICVWHQRNDTDPSHRWLLHQARQALKQALWPDRVEIEQPKNIDQTFAGGHDDPIQSSGQRDSAVSRRSSV